MQESQNSVQSKAASIQAALQNKWQKLTTEREINMILPTVSLCRSRLQALDKMFPASNVTEQGERPGAPSEMPAKLIYPLSKEYKYRHWYNWQQKKKEAK